MDDNPGVVGEWKFAFFTFQTAFLEGDISRAGNCYNFNNDGALKQYAPGKQFFNFHTVELYW